MIQLPSSIFSPRFVQSISDIPVVLILSLQYSGCKIIFFDAGTYVVTDTVTIPAGTQMVGEAWTVLAGRGPAFNNKNSPKAVFRIGEIGSQGVLEITDFIFNTIGGGKHLIL